MTPCRVCLPELCGHPAGDSLAVGGHLGAEETSSCLLGLRAKASQEDRPGWSGHVPGASGLPDTGTDLGRQRWPWTGAAGPASRKLFDDMTICSWGLVMALFTQRCSIHAINHPLTCHLLHPILFT